MPDHGSSPSDSDRRASSFPPAAPEAGWNVYGGCWVALIGDQVAGVGVSEEAALLAARHSRPRERITEVRYVPHTPAGE